jgi:hypothetical protein
MTKNQQLDKLFEEWRSYFREYKDCFISDGIVDDNLFEEQKNKLLFIGKEANDPRNQSWDYRALIKQNLKYKYNLRIAEWSYGILNDFPNFDSIHRNHDLKIETIKKIALLDVKKSGGSGKCNNGSLLNNILANLSFLHRQIDIIKPDIIISGLFEIELVQALFPGISFQKSGYSRCVAKWKDYKVIDFYHPSNQNVPAASYSLLQNIYRSEAFRKL